MKIKDNKCISRNLDDSKTVLANDIRTLKVLARQLLLPTLLVRIRWQPQSQCLNNKPRSRRFNPSQRRRFSRNLRFKGSLPRKTLGPSSKLQGGRNRMLTLGHNSSNSSRDSPNSSQDHDNLSNSRTIMSALPTTMETLRANLLFGVQVL